jgi:aminodeoxyfutalosine deaminase
MALSGHSPTLHESSLVPPPDTTGGVIFLRIDAAGLADARGMRLEPLSILLQFQNPVDPSGFLTPPVYASATLLVAATSQAVDLHPCAHMAHRLSVPDCILLPGLVNAHSHLDLTSIGPIPRDPQAPFSDWLASVIQQRPTNDDQIAASVRLGIAKSLAGGVVAVGDIVGCPSSGPTAAGALQLAASSLQGIAFCEFFAIGSREQANTERFIRYIQALAEQWPQSSRVRLGVSPHAPYSVGSSAYRACAQLGLPLATHLAESLEERQFIAQGSGPQRQLLESLGLWTDNLLTSVGQGLHPVEHTLPLLDRAQSPTLCVHLNDLMQHDLPRQEHLIEQLKLSGVSVVYCPNASNYFGTPDVCGPHAYQELLRAGVPVCLGTDSIMNLPPDRAEVAISTWHEARLLVQRDGLMPTQALELITTAGAVALGLDPQRFVFQPGQKPAGLSLVQRPDTFGPNRSISDSPALFWGLDPPTLLLVGT